MVLDMTDAEAIEKIYKPHCLGLAATLGYLRDEWKVGDEKRVEWMMDGHPTDGESFMVFQRLWRKEVDRVLRKIVRDRLPSTRPWLPDRYAERVLDLVAKMRPYEYDHDRPQRCTRTWSELGLDDELTALCNLLTAEANAVTLKPKAEPEPEECESPKPEKARIPKKSKRRTRAERDRLIGRILRSNPAISQREVARRVNCSPTTVANSESWKRRKKINAVGGDPEAALRELKLEQDLLDDYGPEIYENRPK